MGYYLVADYYSRREILLSRQVVALLTLKSFIFGCMIIYCCTFNLIYPPLIHVLFEKDMLSSIFHLLKDKLSLIIHLLMEPVWYEGSSCRCMSLLCWLIIQWSYLWFNHISLPYWCHGKHIVPVTVQVWDCLGSPLRSDLVRERVGDGSVGAIDISRYRCPGLSG